MDFNKETWLKNATRNTKNVICENGIISFLKSDYDRGTLLAFLGFIFFIISFIGVYYSFKVTYTLSSSQELYNESVKMVDSSQVIKPSYNIFTNKYEVDNYFLFIPSITIFVLSILSLFGGLFYIINFNISFICPNCYKRILLKNIQDYTCPICNEEKLNYINFIEGCNHCGETMRFYDCPHCGKPIDLEAPYNENELKRKRYE